MSLATKEPAPRGRRGRRAVWAGLGLTLVLLTSSCGTSLSLAFGRGMKPGVYAFGGTRLWADTISGNLSKDELEYYEALTLIGAFLDFPLSFAVDVAILPITIWFEAAR